MAISQDVIARLRMLGAAQFEAAAKGASKGVLGIGDAANTTAKKTGELESRTGRLRTAFGKVKGLAAVAGFAAVTKGIKDAVTSTEDLTKATLAIKRGTGLDTETASKWAEVTKVRGIQAQSFQRGLVTLSKQMTAVTHGSKSAVEMFHELGISEDSVAKGDVNAVIGQTADAFQGMQNPAAKAAAAQKLFGRSGLALLPLLNKGSQGIQEQMDLATKYGAVIGDTKNSEKLIEKQRELKYATDGLKITLGEALIPAITQLVSVFAQAAGALNPFLRNATLVRLSVVAITGAFVAYKIAVVASTIASMGMLAVWVAIPLAVIAIGVALVYAYKKVAWFRDAVNAVGAFLKDHWRAILFAMFAPLPALIILAIKHFGKIKSFVASLPKAFLSIGKAMVRALIDGIKASPGAIVDAIKSILPGGKLGKKLFGVVSGVVKQYATGGLIPRGGLGIVGEAGPELVTAHGAGARVVPLGGSAMPSIPAINAQGAGGTFVAKLYLQNREVAQAVAQHTSDVQARR